MDFQFEFTNFETNIAKLTYPAFSHHLALPDHHFVSLDIGVCVFRLFCWFAWP